MKIAKRSNSTEDLAKAKHKRNEVLKLIRHAKSAFIQECSNQTQNDCKMFWGKVNVLLPSGPNTSTIHLEDKVDNVHVPYLDTANFINDFFSTIGQCLAAKFKNNWVYTGQVFDSRLTNIKTTEIEVLELCRNIDLTKASPIAYLSSRVLKDAFCSLVPQLTNLFNMSLWEFTMGIFPQSWKEANIIPLQKGGDKSDVTTSDQYPSYLSSANYLREQSIQKRANTWKQMAS